MIQLRPIAITDAPVLYPLILEPSITASLLYDGPHSLQHFTDGLLEHAAANRVYAILDPATGLPMGAIRVRPSPDERTGELGYWLGLRHQGRGYGTAAIAAVVALAFDEWRMHRLEAKVFIGNWPSRRALEKNGFALEAVISHSVSKRGVWQDEWLFGRLEYPRTPPPVSAS